MGRRKLGGGTTEMKVRVEFLLMCVEMKVRLHSFVLVSAQYLPTSVSPCCDIAAIDNLIAIFALLKQLISSFS
ncbi:hypothetical protein A2U01_0006733 [Trifolium medium]|uniref:Uncharacterized protein n=1 Tax=Trifolium medium TaxID=97028 RepID=A0A392MF16_9FABA|nr:hypothetical protein [Trifolium medium]